VKLSQRFDVKSSQPDRTAVDDKERNFGGRIRRNVLTTYEILNILGQKGRLAANRPDALAHAVLLKADAMLQ